MARRPSEVPEALLADLNAGTRAANNLAESLAIDLGELLRCVAPELGAAHIDSMRAMREDGYTKCLRFGGKLLLDRFGRRGIRRFASHPSDTVRGWAAYMVGLDPKLKLPDKIDRIRPFADDPHYGVREWAWLAVRDGIVAAPLDAVTLLEPWTADASANVRRFATEATRPRGVWCAHIPEFKESPQLALSLLEPMRSDPEKYVQDSVANWLNDAAKTRPEWVVELTDRWLNESATKATVRICKRARRSL